MDDSPTRRTARILGVGARTLGRSVLKRLPGGDRAQKRIDYWRDVGRDLSNTLGELRGAAMKFGQLASQYADVLPPELAEQLKSLQRSAEPLPLQAIQRALDEQWTGAQWAMVDHLDPVAMAAASIGQVHHLKLRNGRTAVVKVRYPGVERAVDADLTQLRRLISVSKLLPLDGPAMDRLMEEVRERFREETNYCFERANLTFLRKHARVPDIVYPKDLPELSGEGVLVLSHESGTPLELARNWPQACRNRIGLALTRWLAHQLFVAHAIHADPHPGNFAFRENGEVVVYDFGCVKRIPPTVVSQVRQLLRASALHDWQGVHDVLEQLGGLADGSDARRLAPFYRKAHALAGDQLGMPGPFDFSRPDFIHRLRRHARDHIGLTFRFKPIPDLVFVMRALSGHYWLLRALGAQVDVGAVLAAHDVHLRTPQSTVDDQPAGS